MRGVRLAVVVVWLFGAVSACSGTEVIDSGAEPVTGSEDGGGQALTVEEVAPSLAFFGDLAVVRSEPVTTPFDTAATSLDLGDGATVEVPAGAFAEPTEVTSVIVDLDFGRYVENPPQGTVYVLSTEADVDLGVPVMLEVPIPADLVRVMQSIDTEWQLLDIAAGPTTRIPITHFSDVLNTVVQPGDGDPLIIGEEPRGDVPGAYLLGCMGVLGNPLRDRDSGPPATGDDLRANLAWSVCVRALVNEFSPPGERVEVSCVGDKIGGEVDFQGAIDACVAENKPAEPPVDSSDIAADTSDDAADASSALAEDPAAVDPAAVDSGLIPDGSYQGTLLQTREQLVPDGTAEFTVADGLIEASVGLNVDGPIRFWNGEPVCWIWVIYEFAGTGPVNSPVVLTLEPKVEEVVEVKGEDCEANERWSSTAEQDMRSSFGELLYFHEVTYTDGRIEGTFTGSVWGMDLKVIAG